MPVALGNLVVLVVFVGRDIRDIRAVREIRVVREIREIFCGESENIIRCAEFKMVTVALLKDGRSLPLQEDIVFSIIDGPLNDGRMVVLGGDDRLVAFGFCPVVGIVGVVSCRIGEPKGDCCPSVF
jgi:hypothetical protein